MVYDTKTLKPLHPLTEEGKQAYAQMLERAADEILFKSKHPFKYWTRRIRNLILTGDSAWDGAQYAKHEQYKDGYSYSK